MAKESHTYRCTAVPSGCTTFAIMNNYDILVDEPAPQSYTYPDGPCQGAIFELNEESD
ncbi:MAG: hypothetical protein JWM57_177 [Phycisphaerales bacterium]|nr:hypothetical protein [Phycisphaerales bacterium]